MVEPMTANMTKEKLLIDEEETKIDSDMLGPITANVTIEELLIDEEESSY